MDEKEMLEIQLHYVLQEDPEAFKEDEQLIAELMLFPSLEDYLSDMTIDERVANLVHYKDKLTSWHQ